jgi:glycosyltransferase involved in cell wall biosynthesis
METSKPHILYIVTRSERGGAQTHILDLIRYFRNDFDVDLVIGEEDYITNNDFLISKARALGINVHILPFLKRSISPLEDIKACKDFYSLVKTLKPDLIHAHTFKAGFIAKVVSALRNVPVIYTPHAWSFSKGTPLLQQAIAIPLEYMLSFMTTKVICVSMDEYRLGTHRRVLRSRQGVMIHNGVADTEYRAEPGNVTQLGNENPLVFVMTARFAVPKEPHLLIRALATLRELSSCRLWFIGDGPLLAESQALAKELGVQDDIDFLGSRDDVAELLAQAHVFVLSTNWEAMPLTILEAMRTGLPVIAHDVGGIREAVIDNVTGLVVPPRNLAALTRALERLVNNPREREGMGKAGRELYEKKFSLTQQLELTQGVYQQVLESQNRAKGTL